MRSAPVQIAQHDLGPYQRLYLPPGEHVLVVRDGVLIVELHDEELAFIPGDEVIVQPGELRGVRNATRGSATVVALWRGAAG